MIPVPRLAVLAAALLAGAAGAHAQAPAKAGAVIEATGHGVVSVPPDRVFIGVAVVTRAQTEQAARESNAGDVQRFTLYAQRAARPDGAVTSGTTRILPKTRPVNDEKGRRTEPDGFEATTMVRIRLNDTEKATDFSRDALTNGADRVVETSYVLADDASAQERARAEAFADARRKAEHLAALGGLKLKQVVRMSLPARDIASAVSGLGYLRGADGQEPWRTSARARSEGQSVDVRVTLDVAWSAE